MKPVIFALALLVCFSANAQQKNVSINHTINDDGNELSIKVKGTVDGKPINYNRTFDVTGMSKEQKDALKERVYDSLGLPSPVAPKAPIAPRAPLTLMAPPEPPAMNAPVPPVPPVVSSKSDYSEFYAIGGDHPYTKEVKYNPKTGLLYLRYRFTKNGEEVTQEKSIDTKGKSKEERDAIIKKYEQEIGVAQPEII
ncbi:MAG: hypothetical protein QM726_15470 [Chitinophagaceae bacterium]